MKEVFEELATQEKVILKSFDNKYSNLDGSKIFSSKYQLEIEYKEQTIFIINEFGHQSIGNFEMKMKCNSRVSNFQISNRSHFWKLFNRKSNILKIECENVSFKHKLEKLIIETSLEKIARENLFEPNIFTRTNDYKNLEIITEYHLAFEDKKGALISLIKFYKALIDLI